MRKLQTAWAIMLLTRWANLLVLAQLEAMPKRLQSCLIDANDFALSLKSIFSCSRANREYLPNHLISDIPRLNLDELQSALQKMANLRCEDEHGIVIEIIKMGNAQLHAEILLHFNRCIDCGEFDA